MNKSRRTLNESKERQNQIVSLDKMDLWRDWKSDLLHDSSMDEEDQEAVALELEYIDKFLRDARMDPNKVYAIDDDIIWDSDMADLKSALEDFENHASVGPNSYTNEFKEATGDKSAFATASFYIADDGSKMLKVWVGSGYESVPAMIFVEGQNTVRESLKSSIKEAFQSHGYASGYQGTMKITPTAQCKGFPDIALNHIRNISAYDIDKPTHYDFQNGHLVAICPVHGSLTVEYGFDAGPHTTNAKQHDEQEAKAKQMRDDFMKAIEDAGWVIE